MNKLNYLYKNKKDLIRTGLIIMLIIIAILQTFGLWYSNLANGGSFFNSNVNAATNNYSARNDFVIPYRMLTTSNGEQFSGLHSKANLSDLGEDIIQKALTSGDFIVTSNIEDDIFKKSTALIYEYKYFVEGKQLAESLNLKNNSWNRIDLFDLIIFSEGENEIIEIDFVNRENGTYTRFDLSNKSELAALKNQIAGINTDIKYTINFQQYIPLEKYTFIPSWKNEVYSYNEIVASNPYTNDFGEVTIKKVEENINLFFENPLNKKFSKKDNFFIFSDSNTNVKYYDLSNYNIGLIEYSYYNYGSQNKNNTVVADFTVAKALMDKDINMVNNYYLSGYTRDESETVFKFDYIINNLPIYFSSDYYELLDTSAAIEITVRNGVVTKYKKIASNYSINENKRFAKRDVDSVISSIFSENDENEIKNIMLAYKLDVENAHGLHWFIEAYGSVFSQATEGE